MATESESHPPTATLSHPLRILIVDDDPAICELLSDLLEEVGFRTLMAYNGQAALTVLQQQRVALVLTDLMMPQLTGVQLARQLHNTPDTATIPLILMSAALPAVPNVRFAAVIQKPFALDALLALLRQVLHDHLP